MLKWLLIITRVCVEEKKSWTKPNCRTSNQSFWSKCKRSHSFQTSDCSRDRGTLFPSAHALRMQQWQENIQVIVTHAASTWRSGPDKCCVWVSVLSKNQQNKTGVLCDTYVTWANWNTSRALIWTKNFMCTFFTLFSHIAFHCMISQCCCSTFAVM